MRYLLAFFALSAGCAPLMDGELPDEVATFELRPPPVPEAPIAGVVHPAVAVAQGKLGKPYCWGGTGPSCFDCSGLVHRSWRAAGVSIPRSSAAQHEKLAKVTWDQVMPGDILWRPGHVGLYVGQGWAIHAPGEGKTVQYQPAQTYREVLRVQ